MTSPFHERLRRFREHEGLAINKAAARAGVSIDRWREYESGRAMPNRLEIKKVFGSHCRIVNEVPEDGTAESAISPTPPPGSATPPIAPSLPSWSVAIRTERTKEKLSQEDLAQILDIHVKTVSNWETGQVVPIEPHRLKLIEALPGLQCVIPEGRNVVKAIEKRTAGPTPEALDTKETMRRVVALANALRGCRDSYAILRVDEAGVRAILVVGGDRVEEIDRASEDEILAELKEQARLAREEGEKGSRHCADSQNRRFLCRIWTTWVNIWQGSGRYTRNTRDAEASARGWARPSIR